MSRAQLGGADYTTFQRMLIGYGYAADSKLSVEVNLDVRLNDRTAFLVASRYDFDSVVQFRLACESEPRSAEVGISLQLLSHWSAQSLVHYHDVLGITMGGGVSYTW